MSISPGARPFVRIDAWNDIPRAISLMQQAGVPRCPALQALYQGRIAHLEVQRTGSTKLFKVWAKAVRLPALALIGDDDHATSDGPTTWSVAPRLLRWAKFVLIHGGAGMPSHYEYAVTMTELFGRVLMIECSSANITAWQEAASKWAVGAQGQVLQPPPGCVHPSLEKGRMQ